MQHELTAVIERDGAWYIAHSLEIPGANGQAKSSSSSAMQEVKFLGIETVTV